MAAQDEGPRRTAAPRKDGPWFASRCRPRPAPRPPSKSAPARQDRPSHDAATPEFGGDVIKADVATIVGFARAAAQRKEIGNGQMWGRISGFPSSSTTVDWAVNEFRKAGIADVKAQEINQDEKSSLWLPLSWKVTLIGDQAFGSGLERCGPRVRTCRCHLRHSRAAP